MGGFSKSVFQTVYSCHMFWASILIDKSLVGRGSVLVEDLGPWALKGCGPLREWGWEGEDISKRRLEHVTSKRDAFFLKFLTRRHFLMIYILFSYIPLSKKGHFINIENVQNIFISCVTEVLSLFVTIN